MVWPASPWSQLIRAVVSQAVPARSVRASPTCRQWGGNTGVICMRSPPATEGCFQSVS
jgi:hypothetical protein